MFGIGWTEFIVIALVLLIFVGPRQLPGMLKKVGQIVGELKSASRELRNQVSSEVREIEDGIRAAAPSELISGIKDDLGFEEGSPYEVARRGKDAVRRELNSIKDSIESAEDPPRKDGPDCDGARSDEDGKERKTT